MQMRYVTADRALVHMIISIYISERDMRSVFAGPELNAFFQILGGEESAIEQFRVNFSKLFPGYVILFQ